MQGDKLNIFFGCWLHQKGTIYANTRFTCETKCDGCGERIVATNWSKILALPQKQTNIYMWWLVNNIYIIYSYYVAYEDWGFNRRIVLKWINSFILQSFHIPFGDNCSVKHEKIYQWIMWRLNSLCTNQQP